MPLLSQSVSKSYSKPKPSIELISSHTELFAPNPPNPPSQPQSQPRSQPQPQDRIVLLAPLHNDTYITTHPATSFDFTTWLPLLAVGAPETWYAFGSVPDAQPILTSLDQPLLAPPKTALKPQTEVNPTGLKLPRISSVTAGPLISPAASGSSSVSLHPFSIKTDAGVGIHESPQLIYLSIQQALSISSPPQNLDSHNTGYDTHHPNHQSYCHCHAPQSAPISQNIYRVVRTGSREEAAAQAYCAAAINRWSTVFTCVVAGGQRALSGRVMVLDGKGQGLGYERVGSLEELVRREREGKGLFVFY